MSDARTKRLARNEAIRQWNRMRSDANELRPRRFMTTVVMSGHKPDERDLCPARNVTLTAADHESGVCTNCQTVISQPDSSF